MIEAETRRNNRVLLRSLIQMTIFLMIFESIPIISLIVLFFCCLIMFGNGTSSNTRDELFNGVGVPIASSSNNNTATATTAMASQGSRASTTTTTDGRVSSSPGITEPLSDFLFPLERFTTVFNDQQQQSTSSVATALAGSSAYTASQQRTSYNSNTTPHQIDQSFRPRRNHFRNVSPLFKILIGVVVMWLVLDGGHYSDGDNYALNAKQLVVVDRENKIIKINEQQQSAITTQESTSVDSIKNENIDANKSKKHRNKNSGDDQTEGDDENDEDNDDDEDKDGEDETVILPIAFFAFINIQFWWPPLHRFLSRNLPATYSQRWRRITYRMGIYPNPRPRGSAPAALDRIANVTLSAIDFEQNGPLLTCAVCLENMERGEVVKKLLCNHYFHANCILPWLANHNSCPTCRTELETNDEEYEAIRVERASRPSTHQSTTPSPNRDARLQAGSAIASVIQMGTSSAATTTTTASASSSSNTRSSTSTIPEFQDILEQNIEAFDPLLREDALQSTGIEGSRIDRTLSPSGETVLPSRSGRGLSFGLFRGPQLRFRRSASSNASATINPQ